MVFDLVGVDAGPDGAPILVGLTVEVPLGGITVLAGVSGSGKSTMLRLLNRLDEPTAGEIRWGGRLITEWVPTELRRKVAMVFQRPSVFAGTVAENLRVARPALTDGEAVAALARVDLGADLLDQDASTLSGGEAQRMCLARSLLTDPQVLLADEPTSSLDGAARQTLEDLALALAAGGMAIVWVTHDVEQLRRLADHLMVIHEGRVLAAGHLDELDASTDPIVRRIIGAP
jgi:putative ABC transport system ATP-binding protein